MNGFSSTRANGEGREPAPSSEARADTTPERARRGFRATWARTVNSARIGKVQARSGKWPSTPGAKSKSYIFETREYANIAEFYADYEARLKSGSWALVAGEFAPDLILVSAGFDSHRADPLAGLALESEDFGQMAVEVRELGARLGAPVGAVLEGGYSPPALADSVAATMRGLGGAGDLVAATETAVAEAAAARTAAYWPSVRS